MSNRRNSGTQPGTSYQCAALMIRSQGFRYRGTAAEITLTVFPINAGIYEKSRFVLRAVRGYNERKSASDFPGDFDHSMHRIGLPDSPDISGRMRGFI